MRRTLSVLTVVTAACLAVGHLNTRPVHADRAQALAAELPVSFSSLVQRLKPSVVTITCTVLEKDANSEVIREGPVKLDPFELPKRRGRVSGSGVIVDPQGYILTNEHVVTGATRIQAKVASDGATYPARLIGTDPESDLAVIKVDAPKPLRAVTVANSDSVQVGDWAIAIGSPFGLETTVTAGIISAKGRDLGDPEHPMQRFLQTDAAINRGNSGGPLLNIRGEVIGINTAMASETGGYAGIGFALPSNLALNVYNQIVKNGRVMRGAIGVSFSTDTNSTLLKAFHVESGVFVQSVAPGTPAASAGLKAGDIIVGFQGHPVKCGEDLLEEVANSSIGAGARITAIRGGKRKDYHVVIADRAAVAGVLPSQFPSIPGELDDNPLRLGISVRSVAQENTAALKLPEKSGLMVLDVESGSFAEEARIIKGDVITAINQKPVGSLSDLHRLQKSFQPGEAIAFRLLRRSEDRSGGGAWQVMFTAGSLPTK